MTTIAAHFDGKTFVPDEPVAGLRPGDRVEVITGANDTVSLLAPVIVGLEPALARAIAEDATLAAENL